MLETPTFSSETDGLRVRWPDGHEAWFHHFWLRENCHCGRCTHHDAWERILDFRAIPLDLAPASIHPDDQGLRIDWPEHPAPCSGTWFSWNFLDSHRTEPEARRTRKRRPVPWRAGEFGVPDQTVDCRDFQASDEGLRRALDLVENRGFCIIDGVPDRDRGVVSVAERIAPVEDSHFGRTFDVRSKPVAENLAYTPRALHPHNDLASRQHLPGVQFLHCRVNDATGGESVFVDSLAVADELRTTAPEAFEVLGTEAVTHSSRAGTWDVVNRGPIIEVDADGDVTGTRFHPALLGPVDVPPDRMGAFYSAYRAMLEIAIDPGLQFEFRLEAGQCQVFDNQRVMHARREFDPSSGARLLQGCYVSLDGLRSRSAVLQRRGADFRMC
ncbi:MAG: DUF971 domain-containing protein [Actinomycetia bacterium]|nr:DUF971 domain-containing protein [Actinomycetes bacterium]